MLSDHTYSAKCSRCEICPDCGLDPKSHYKQEEVSKLLTSKFFFKQSLLQISTLRPAQSTMYMSVCLKNNQIFYHFQAYLRLS